MTDQQPSSPALSEAIDRFLTSRAAKSTAEQQADLDAWLAASPENADAMREVQEQWAVMDAMRGDTAILFMREAARRDVPKVRFRRLLRSSLPAGLAAATLFGVVLGPMVYQRHLSQEARAHATTFKTRVGEVTRIRLDDGTLATLDTGTELRAWQEKKARYVELVRGRARFQVVKDATRPFSVLAAGKKVTALGTDFDVYVRPTSLRVSLVEGRLRVTGEGRGRNAASVDMTAGYRLTAGPTSWALARADANADLSWTDKQLTFEAAPLGEIAEELNRYSDAKILVRDPMVAQKRMNAVIRNDDRNAFLVAVEELSLARVRRVGQNYELVRR